MGEREWNRSDVVMLGVEVALRVEDRGDVYFIDGDGLHWRREDSQARPLVVIDPEDRGQVERIWREQERGIDAIREANPNQVGVSLIDALQVGLRRMLDPEHTPKPEEPTGLGAVVKDAEGVAWVRSRREHKGLLGVYWESSESLAHSSWHNIAAVRVLSEGVQL